MNVNKTVAGSKIPGQEDASTENASSPDEAQHGKKENLRRAKELVALHYEVKSRHANGQVDEELRQAREAVERVLMELA